MQVVITQIPACYEIMDKKAMHKTKDEYKEVVNSYNVLNENRLESSYPRVPSSPIPGSLLHDTREGHMRVRGSFRASKVPQVNKGTETLIY
jgi:hypothetical protein